MSRILWIGVGGAAGALLRYGAVCAAQGAWGSAFPFGTLGVNLTGSLIAGILFGVFETAPISPDLKAALFVGVLGGYTTFSAFSLENFLLLRKAEYGACLWNVTLNVFLGICLVFAGYGLAKFLISSNTR